MGTVVEDRKLVTGLGWEYRTGFWYEWPVKDEIRCDEFSNRAIDFRLNFVAPDRYVTIEAYERNSFDWETVYCGPYVSQQHLFYLMETFNLIQI